MLLKGGYCSLYPPPGPLNQWSPTPWAADCPQESWSGKEKKQLHIFIFIYNLSEGSLIFGKLFQPHPTHSRHMSTRLVTC